VKELSEIGKVIRGIQPGEWKTKAPERMLRRRDALYFYRLDGEVILASDRRYASMGAEFLGDVKREELEQIKPQGFFVRYESGDWSFEVKGDLTAAVLAKADMAARADFEKK
jgi:hypothetical protein